MHHLHSDFLNRSKKRGPEAHIQLQCIHYLKAKGYIVGKIKSFGLKNRFDIYMWRGLPDLLIFTPRLYFLEIKAGNNKQSPEQIKFQEYCNKANIPYLLIRSIEEIQRVFP